MRLIISIMMTLCVTLMIFSCKEPSPPEDDIIINPPDTTPQPDPFSDFIKIDSCFRTYPDLCAFDYLDHFLIDSVFYVFSKDFQLATFNMDGDLLSSGKIYTPVFESHEYAVRYNPVNKLFFIVGEVNNGTGFYTENPMLLVVDMEGNLVHEDIQLYNNDYINYFHRVVFNQDNSAVIIENCLEGSNGNYKWVFYLDFINGSYQPVKRIKIAIDDISYLYNFWVSPDNKMRLLGFQHDGGLTSKGNTFYALFNYAGDLESINLIADPYSDYYNQEYHPEPGGGQSDIFHWWEDCGSLEMTFEKVQPSGDVLSTRNIRLVQGYSYTFIGHDLELCQDTDENILIYGYFANGYDGNNPPVFFGNFIIKVEKSGSEKYRVLFNSDLTGHDNLDYFPRYPELTVTGDDEYVLFNSVSLPGSGCWGLCFSKVKVDSAMYSLP